MSLQRYNDNDDDDDDCSGTTTGCVTMSPPKVAVRQIATRRVGRRTVGCLSVRPRHILIPSRQQQLALSTPTASNKERLCVESNKERLCVESNKRGGGLSVKSTFPRLPRVTRVTLGQRVRFLEVGTDRDAKPPKPAVKPPKPAAKPPAEAAPTPEPALCAASDKCVSAGSATAFILPILCQSAPVSNHPTEAAQEPQPEPTLSNPTASNKKRLRIESKEKGRPLSIKRRCARCVESDEDDVSFYDCPRLLRVTRKRAPARVQKHTVKEEQQAPTAGSDHRFQLSPSLSEQAPDIPDEQPTADAMDAMLVDNTDDATADTSSMSMRRALSVKSTFPRLPRVTLKLAPALVQEHTVKEEQQAPTTPPNEDELSTEQQPEEPVANEPVMNEPLLNEPLGLDQNEDPNSNPGASTNACNDSVIMNDGTDGVDTSDTSMQIPTGGSGSRPTNCQEMVSAKLGSVTGNGISQAAHYLIDRCVRDGRAAGEVRNSVQLNVCNQAVRDIKTLAIFLNEQGLSLGNHSSDGNSHKKTLNLRQGLHLIIFRFVDGNNESNPHYHALALSAKDSRLVVPSLPGEYKTVSFCNKDKEHPRKFFADIARRINHGRPVRRVEIRTTLKVEKKD